MLRAGSEKKRYWRSGEEKKKKANKKENQESKIKQSGQCLVLFVFFFSFFE